MNRQHSNDNVSRPDLRRRLIRGLNDPRVTPETKAKGRRALRLLAKLEVWKRKRMDRCDGKA